MIPLIAEISWAGAFLSVGLMGEFAFVVWAVLKYGGTTDITTTIEKFDEPVSNYKETKTTIDRDEIKRILRELQLEKELEMAKQDADRNLITQALKKTAEEMRTKNDPTS
jgi:hypothetical protein